MLGYILIGGFRPRKASTLKTQNIPGTGIKEEQENDTSLYPDWHRGLNTKECTPTTQLEWWTNTRCSLSLRVDQVTHGYGLLSFSILQIISFFTVDNLVLVLSAAYWYCDIKSWTPLWRLGNCMASASSLHFTVKCKSVSRQLTEYYNGIMELAYYVITNIKIKKSSWTEHFG